jgi:hypothetical protein
VPSGENLDNGNSAFNEREAP